MWDGTIATQILETNTACLVERTTMLLPLSARNGPTMSDGVPLSEIFRFFIVKYVLRTSLFIESLYFGCEVMAVQQN